MRTLTCANDFIVPALPERIFPLLCPVREYDWIPTWQGETWLAAQSEEAQRKMVDTLRLLLTHYLATGQMLRP